jgi:hypothetical protein
VTWVLKWYIFFPVASLAYTGGLLNIICAYMYAAWLKSLNGSDDATFLWLGGGDIGTGGYFQYFYVWFNILVLSLLMGLALSLAVERPFMNLAKHVKF